MAALRKIKRTPAGDKLRRARYFVSGRYISGLLQHVAAKGHQDRRDLLARGAVLWAQIVSAVDRDTADQAQRNRSGHLRARPVGDLIPIREPGEVSLCAGQIDLRDLVILSAGNCMRDQIIELCQAKRDMPSHYSFESGSLDTLMRIVDCTSCLTIIPEMAVEYIPADHRDRLKMLAKGATSRKIAVAVRRTYVKSSIIKALTDTIMANAPEVGN